MDGDHVLGYLLGNHLQRAEVGLGIVDHEPLRLEVCDLASLPQESHVIEQGIAVAAIQFGQEQVVGLGRRSVFGPREVAPQLESLSPVWVTTQRIGRAHSNPNPSDDRTGRASVGQCPHRPR